MGCKKMEYRIDGIFQIYVDNMKYGAVKVVKKFKETNCFTDGYKLEKTMYDILICLSKEVHFEETRVRKLQIVSILHLNLKLQVSYLSSFKNYVLILKREKLFEIPATIKKIRNLIRVLANVWMLKLIILLFELQKGCEKVLKKSTKICDILSKK
ncbi:hypothetical protein C1645_736565 [Glomus cerebriforme]|uniref:Uncharacterized protein n=1 Tax=Glomus cerebriforme TaxID=658196 RepID=A0A397TB83_9GLOM|nr:hypothetical protein C1645_736565 [Glomus cerebriforme]